MTSVDTDGTGGRATRFWRQLREADPGKLGYLGVLSVPGYLFESLEFLQPFVLFCLAFFWWWVAPIADHFLSREAKGETEPTDWIHMGDTRELLVFYLSFPLLLCNPLVVLQDLFQTVGSAVAYARHRGSLPTAGDGQPTYRLPVSGTWTVVNGSLEKEHSHSWIPVTQRYAYDLVRTDEDGRSQPEGAPPSVDEYYCYDEPVLAPAEGVVVDALDTDLEPGRGGGFAHPLKRDIRGNYLTIQHGPEAYSTLAHLVPGSLTVSPGERVARGQEIGRCGHTGNSSEPHLHFQFQDQPAFETAAGLPPLFEGVDVESPWLEGASEPADPEEPTAVEITAGQRVSATPEKSEPAGGSSETTGRGLFALLERTALGVSSGAVIAAVVGLFTSPVAVLVILAALAVVGVALRFVFQERVARPGWLGVPLGLAVIAGLRTLGPAAARSPLVLVLCGLAGFVAAAEVDRRRLRRAFADGESRESGRRSATEA